MSEQSTEQRKAFMEEARKRSERVKAAKASQSAAEMVVIEGMKRRFIETQPED